MAGMIGWGAHLAVDDAGTGAASGASTDFAQVTSINVPKSEAAFVESTHLLSSSRTREFCAGLIDSGTCSFTQNWAEAEYARLLALRGATHTYKIFTPDGSNATFTAILTSTDAQFTPDAVSSMSSELKISGPVVFVVA